MTDYQTVRDIPDTYTLLTGDEANEITGDGGCAFVLIYCDEIVDAYATEYNVPWLDAPVYKVQGVADSAFYN